MQATLLDIFVLCPREMNLSFNMTRKDLHDPMK